MRHSPWHQVIDKNGVGKCGVPMWQNDCPAGFCDKTACGPQEDNQRRYGDYIQGRWNHGYSSGLACYRHGGPMCRDDDIRRRRNENG